MRDKPCGQAGLGLRTRGRLGLVGAGWSWTTNSWAFGSRRRLALRDRGGRDAEGFRERERERESGNVLSLMY